MQRKILLSITLVGLVGLSLLLFRREPGPVLEAAASPTPEAAPGVPASSTALPGAPQPGTAASAPTLPAAQEGTAAGNPEGPSNPRVSPTQEPIQTIAPTPIALSPNPTEGLLGAPPTPPGEPAPDVTAGPLQFTNIHIYQDPATGRFAGRADVQNTGTTFLNNLVIGWQVLDSAGQVLDQGQLAWPNLAPGETASLLLSGSAGFADVWQRVVFLYTP